MVTELVNKLNVSKDAFHEQWSNNKNKRTKHIVVDNFISDEICRNIYQNLISLENKFLWQKYFLQQSKGILKNLDYVSQPTRDIYSAIHSKEFIGAVENITGIKDLKSDTTFYAGGLTMMNKNDFLSPHIDNSHDKKKEKYRRINILFYVTPDWSLSRGGNLELWDKEVKTKKTIVSKFNRMVIMETNKTSWHSVSQLTSNDGRCCLSTYYFTKDSPENYEYSHVTSFMSRPEQKFHRLYNKFDNYLRGLNSLLFK